MLDPKYKKYAERIKALIEEGKEVVSLEKPSSVGPYIDEPERINTLLIKVKNILDVTFGKQSEHFKHLLELEKRNPHFEHSYEIDAVVGLLKGSLDDLEGGFLTGQEFLIAGEIFDSVLEQAKELNEKGYKNPAAVLGRVVVEDALRRLARQEGINDNLKASGLNDQLKKAGKYNQPRWRRVQVWLDIGNFAAHGEFEKYTEDEVKTMLDEIERFLAEEIHGG